VVQVRELPIRAVFEIEVTAGNAVMLIVLGD
jgi:hypothetical protein